MLKMEFSYYHGAVFLGIGIVFMLTKYDFVGGFFAVFGFVICSWNYKKMEMKKEDYVC